MIPKLIRFLGSIKLAIPLLGIIGIVLAGATVYESSVGSSVVQQEIYKSPWFGGLMFLLAINLAVSTLLRYPWRGARKIGFALAHWGLVVIIAGSAAVIHLSVEGMLLARTDAGPVNTLRVEGDLLEVAAPGQPPQQANLFLKADGTVVPHQVGDLSVLGYSNNAIKTVRFEPGSMVENPAVRLVLTSARMGQTLERWLALAPAAYDHLNIGPAELQLVKADSAEAVDNALLVDSTPEAGRWGTLQIAWASGKAQLIEVQTHLGQELSVGAGTIKLVGFWPDFRLNGNRQPETLSQQMRNPAVQLEITAGDHQERWFVFSNPAFEPIRTQLSGEPLPLTVTYSAPSNAAPDAFFRVVVDELGQLFYVARASQGVKSGPLQIGNAVVPGWADFEITLADYIPNAQVQRQVVPLSERGQEAGEPALQVATANGEPTWIPWGEPTALADDWYVAFSPKLLQLPFEVKLNDFIVERNEGSESVAMWTSAVTLLDPHTGEQVSRQIWMNHPTWFKGWKLAQASWNPGDLKQSTLQVKREPWWVTALTWSGSLMVTAGVATMFYGRAVSKQLQSVSDLVVPSEQEGSNLEGRSVVQVVEG